MPAAIRLLRPEDAPLYRDIRLEALRTHPEAFGASFETEAAQPEAFFAGRLTDNAVFGAFDDEAPDGAALLGTAGFRRGSTPKTAHKGLLWGMYLRPRARGTGLARRLVEAVLDHARDRVELIQLTVVRDNAPARGLYEGMGFAAYGIEVAALKVDGRDLDEILMAKAPP